MDFNPLISLKDCGHESYFLSIEGVTESSLMLKATDGYRVWEQTVDAKTSKPKSRKESDNEYIELVMSCLQHLDTGKRSYDIIMSASGSLQFVVKERLGSMMGLLLKLDMNENFDAATSIRGILKCACDRCADSTRALADASQEIILNREANDTLSETIISYAQAKEDFQDDFFRKTCVVMNAKKREVRRLQEEVSVLQEEVTALRASASKTAKAKPKAAAAAKTKGSKAKKQRKQDSEGKSGESSEEEKELQSDEEESEPDDYNIASDCESTSRGSESDMDSDARPDDPRAASRKKPAAVVRGPSKRKNPPSYATQPASRLKRGGGAGGSQSGASQVISQVLAPVGATETTGSDLTRMLSEPSQADSKSRKRSRRTVVDSQEEVEEIIEKKVAKEPAVASKYKYDQDDDDDDEEEDEDDGEVDVEAAADAISSIPATAATDAVSKRKRAKKSAFDKLYDDSSSEEEDEGEGGNLMDFM